MLFVQTANFWLPCWLSALLFITDFDSGTFAAGCAFGLSSCITVPPLLGAYGQN